ncbi:O-antigen ligase family protein [Burkholderiaceae bacterium UC74_6]
MNVAIPYHLQRLWSASFLAKCALVALVAFLMFFFAAASVILPWWFVLVVVLFPIVLVAALAMPVFGLFIMLVLVCGLVPESLSPSIKLGAGQVKAHELFMLLMLGFALARRDAINSLKPYVGWLLPVFGILALTVSAVMVAFFIYRTAPRDIFSDARNFLGWLPLFCLVGMIRTQQQLTRLQKSIIALGLLVSLAALLQFFTGRSFVQNARVEELATLSQSLDLTRSIVGASNYFLIFSLYLLLARMMTGSTSVLAASPLVVFLVAGLVVNFGRGVWLTSLGGAILLAYWLAGWRGIGRIVVAGLLGLALALGALALAKPKIIEAAYERLVSATSEKFERDTSLGWRLEEVTDATEKIQGSPFVGVGVGTAYKPLIRMNGRSTTVSDEVMTRYIHNAYVGLWLKLGILGPLCVAAIIWGVLRRGLKMAREAKDVKTKALSLTIVASFVVPVVTSITQPEWLDQTGIAFFATVLALQIIVHRLATAGEPEIRTFGIPKRAEQAAIVL